MSIVGMADNKVLRDQKADGTQPAPKGVPANVVNQLVLFIPVEIITLWVALLAVLDEPKVAQGKRLCDGDFTAYWVWFLVFVLLTIFLTLGLTYRKAKDAGQNFKLPWFETWAGVAGFAAWAVALPETPLASWCRYDEAWGSFIVLGATVGITTVGCIAGKTVRFQKI